jgi:hypothetical protein
MSYEEVLEHVKQLSQEERLELVRELTKSSKEVNGTRARSLFDAFNARGLVGFMIDAPTDLSTNPKHMEGFGRHA